MLVRDFVRLLSASGSIRIASCSSPELCLEPDQVGENRSSYNSCHSSRSSSISSSSSRRRGGKTIGVLGGLAEWPNLPTSDYSCCSCKLVCWLTGGRIPATLRRSEMAPAVAAVAIVVVVAAAQATASSSRSSSSSSVPLSLPLTADDLPNQYSFWQHNHSEFKACAHPHPYSVG